MIPDETDVFYILRFGINNLEAVTHISRPIRMNSYKGTLDIYILSYPVKDRWLILFTLTSLLNRVVGLVSIYTYILSFSSYISQALEMYDQRNK